MGGGSSSNGGIGMRGLDLVGGVDGGMRGVFGRVGGNKLGGNKE